eukprot:scaffold451_cov365-Prasinococcus_capsulatus_cf.AAC.27
MRVSCSCIDGIFLGHLLSAPGVSDGVKQDSTLVLQETSPARSERKEHGLRADRKQNASAGRTASSAV